jgi:hypothetical protein
MVFVITDCPPTHSKRQDSGKGRALLSNRSNSFRNHLGALKMTETSEVNHCVLQYTIGWDFRIMYQGWMMEK